MKRLTIGLIGNPNAGKTTLFNQLTGSRQRVGNWAGVTVERKVGRFHTDDHKIELVDLPGTYSLTTISEQTSLDEQIACYFILSGEADMLINVVDASNLERNLYLTLQLVELGVPCIVALNMLDIAQSQHIDINIAELEKQLGCPVIPMVSTRATGIDKLKKAIDTHPQNSQQALVEYPPQLLQAVDSLSEQISAQQFSHQQRRWLALQILEGDIYSRQRAEVSEGQLLAIRQTLKESLNEEPELLIADARYQSIATICNAAINNSAAEPNRLTQSLDKFILSRWLGVPIFLFVMYLMFVLAINIGGALQPFFEGASEAIFIHGIQWLGDYFSFLIG